MKKWWKKCLVMMLAVVLLPKWLFAMLAVVLLPAVACAEVEVTISDEAVNTVNPYMFGGNLSWRADGFGLWDTKTNALDEVLLEALRNSGLTSLRFPGGIEASYMHWEETIGENRVPQVDPFSKEWPTQTLENGALFTPNYGFDEFIETCERTGIQPSIILNVGNGTPREAADWIHYCLDKGIKLADIDVGNEEHFEHFQVPGLDITKTEEEYIAFFNELYAILEAELSPEQLDELNIGVIGLPNNHPLCKRRTWDSQILKALSDRIDYFDVHIGYSTYNAYNSKDIDTARAFMGSATWISYMLETVKKEIKKYSGEHADQIGIHISEIGSMTTGTQHYHSVAGAVYMADLLNMLLREPQVTSASYAYTINHYAAATLIGSVEYPVISEKLGRITWKTVMTHVYDAFTPLVNQDVLKVEVGGETFDTKGVGLMGPVKNVPMGDVGAYLAQDGTLTLVILCRDVDKAQDFTIHLPAGATFISGQKMNHKNFFTYNTYARQEYVVPVELDASAVSLDGQTLTLNCPPVSMTVIKLALDR